MFDLRMAVQDFMQPKIFFKIVRRNTEMLFPNGGLKPILPSG
jgi:hypothetical protein